MDRATMRKRLLQRPKNVRFEELCALLEAYGFALVRTTGSHHQYRRGGVTFPLPRQKPTMKPTYVREVLQLTEGEDDGDDD